MSSGVIILFVAAAAVFVYSRRRGRLPLPPGPPPKLFIGNAHELLPKNEPWRTYVKWAEIYGPILSFRVPNRQFIVLSSLKVATELLDVRATTYSDRPKIWMIELAKRNLNPFNVSFKHPYFKEYRTALKNGLSTRTILNYQSVQADECRVLLNGLHKNPDDFADHIRRNTAAIVLNLAYGWKVADDNDHFVKMLSVAFESNAILSLPGRWWVEGMPFLRFLPSWFPGAGFKRAAIDYGKKLGSLDTIPFNWTKQQIQGGSYTRSFVSDQLLPEDGSTVSPRIEDITMRCGQVIYGGGSDTTASSMKSFILAMVIYPEVQKLAQAEIDAVVGQDRFPTFEDRDKLPYVQALALELLRWAPVSPQGLPHHAMRDDVYEGYRIPKGAAVIANLVSMSRDKEMYPDPTVFKPERFLGPSPQSDPRKWFFGFGRRRCPGSHLAEATLFLNISCILAAFTIAKPLDERGKEFTPPPEYHNVGVLWHPKPFKCRFMPRNQDLLATLSH
ncbi:cytochrome P450 [Suillus subalutaceus]|uniref:cytochrome P450 n=1 Tax=Suillus subalutaceus TaxID=48586 RepID=UPI001B8818A2|nr:cytochrome P450 [Suillus subalutaceus]KAG1840272.1 cytochrome P450 [Suillus subalutaceus]